MLEQKANPGIWRRVAALLSACLVLSLPMGCNWQPRTLHSDVYQSGRVHSKGHGELGVHVLPGVGLDMGLGGKSEVHLGYDMAGDEISGLEGRLTRGFLQSAPIYNSISFGADYLEASDHGFKATRFHVGHTLTLLGKDQTVGLHLPLQLYYLSYDWDLPHNFDEFAPSPGQPPTTGKTSANGFYGLVGLGLSVTGKNVAFRVGGNFPTREYVDEVELVPTVGAKLSLRW